MSRCINESKLSEEEDEDEDLLCVFFLFTLYGSDLCK